MNFFTGRAFECSDDAVPCIMREHYTLSHRVGARDGPVMANSLPRPRSDILVNTDQLSEKLTKVN
jgi:hypothetical protein